MQNLCSKDFYKETYYNSDTKNQLWLETVQNTHDCYCNCNTPYAHLLACLFPPGHKDRDTTIQEILQRDYKERCLSGGNADAGPGFTTTDIKEEDTRKEDLEEDFGEENLDELLAAAADAEKR
nr:MAG: hypothetical protein [Gammatorquevirus sp.]